MSSGETYLTAFCSGIVSGVLSSSNIMERRYKFCPPPGVNLLQAMKVLVKFMNDHPDQLHQEVAVLATAAFFNAWPCR